MVCFPAGVLDIYFRGNLLAVLLLVVVRVLACPETHQHTRLVYALRRADIGLWLSAAPAMDQVRRFDSNDANSWRI